MMLQHLNDMLIWILFILKLLMIFLLPQIKLKVRIVLNPLAIGFSQMLKGLTCAVVGEMREDTSLIGFVKAELN